MKKLRIIIVAIILVTVGVFIYLTAGTDAETLLLERIMVMDQRTILMVLLICMFTLLSTLTGLPVFYLSMALGFLLEFTPAILVSYGLNLLAVMATFFMVRFAFTSFFRDRYGQRKMIGRINSRIERYGSWTVAFSRSIYIIPTNIINFSFPLSHISPRKYLLGTAMGLVPECLLNVLTGYLIKHEVILLSGTERISWQVLLIGGFILVFTLLFILLRIRRQRRKREKPYRVIPY